jgi:hypothetical protein
VSPHLRLVTLPDPRPPLVSTEQIYDLPDQPFVQDSLALDFDADEDDEEEERARLTTRGQLPDPGPVVEQLAQAIVEVMAGLRPPPQLVRWTSPEVYAVLCRRSHVAARRALPRRPAIVRRIRVQEPADGVAEAAAVVVHHDRVRALALRLVGLDRRWVVVQLQIG